MFDCERSGCGAWWGVPPSKPPAEIVASNRDLARRARRFANNLTADADRVRMLDYADELEKQADDLEADAVQQSAAPSGKS
jgi:uncharacterized protein YcaQ